jgi:pyridoxine kinase
MNGYEIDTINTVNFSNHTGYPVWKGEVLSGDQLWTIFQGLRENGLLDGYTHLLTGLSRSREEIPIQQQQQQQQLTISPSLARLFVCLFKKKGYVRSASCLERLSEMLDVLRQANPNLIYVCDPVMGDDGKLYVPQENVAVFRRIIPRADYLFPNQTEAE